MADINNIETIEDLLAVVAEYCKTPKIPKLKGSELGIILTKMIELIPGGEVEPVTPPAPTSGIVDDEENTFTFTLASGHSAAHHQSRYQVTGESFTSWITQSNNVVVLPDEDIAENKVEVRVMAIGINPVGPVLTNDDPFTKAGLPAPPAPTNPIVNNFNKTFTFTPDEI